MWISVNERKPGKYSYCLALMKDGYISTAFYGKEEAEAETWEMAGNPVMYWEYLENPIGLPGLEMDNAYKNWWAMGKDFKESELRRAICDEGTAELNKLADRLSAIE